MRWFTLATAAFLVLSVPAWGWTCKLGGKCAPECSALDVQGDCASLTVGTSLTEFSTWSEQELYYVQGGVIHECVNGSPAPCPQPNAQFDRIEGMLKELLARPLLEVHPEGYHPDWSDVTNPCPIGSHAVVYATMPPTAGCEK